MTKTPEPSEFVMFCIATVTAGAIVYFVLVIGVAVWGVFTCPDCYELPASSFVFGPGGILTALLFGIGGGLLVTLPMRSGSVVYPYGSPCCRRSKIRVFRSPRGLREWHCRKCGRTWRIQRSSWTMLPESSTDETYVVKTCDECGAAKADYRAVFPNGKHHHECRACGRIDETLSSDWQN